MENVWEKLKTLKGRPWADTKSIFNKFTKDIYHAEEVVQTYHVNSEPLPEEDVRHKRNGTGNGNGTVSKKFSFISPNKKKHSKKGSKSTSEDDSESVISSETWSPAVDLHENQSSDSNTGTVRDDSIVDIISVEEIPSEDSKPPTPGPQDLYEEFAVPYSEEVSNAFSSAGETSDSSKSSYSNSKSTLKLKIIGSKEATVAPAASNVKSQTTSLLEAHLLSNTKYNTSSSGLANVDIKFKPNADFKLTSSKNGNENETENQHQYAAAIEVCGGEESVADGEESWKTPFSQPSGDAANGSSKVKTETKISIPISALPQNVKIIGSLKKSNSSKTTAMGATLLKSGGGGQKTSSIASADSKEKLAHNQSSSPPSYDVAAAVAGIETETVAADELSGSDVVVAAKEKSPTRSKKNKKSKSKNRLTKSADFNLDRHCGVLVDENKHCLRSLTCKTHGISLKRAVEGRSKEFDKLLADHRASKEALKEHDRNQNLSLSEPIISIPILTVDKISGNTIQIPSSANNEAETVRIRVPNLITNPEIGQKHQLGNVAARKIENEKAPPKSTTSAAKLTPAPVSGPQFCSRSTTNSAPRKASANISSTLNMNGELATRLYDNDVKISFVCSDMLYKVGGLLYTDRSRQAIRKCMTPLILQAGVKTPISPKVSPHPRRKITDFLQLVKNSAAHPPIKLNLFKDENSENDDAVSQANFPTNDAKPKSSPAGGDELERMKRVLANSSKILNNLSADENELRALRLTRQRRLKRPADKDKDADYGCVKKVQRYTTNESYDIGILFPSSNTCDGRGGSDIGGGDLLDTNNPSCAVPFPAVLTTSDACYSYDRTTAAAATMTTAGPFSQSINVVESPLMQCSENARNVGVGGGGLMAENTAVPPPFNDDKNAVRSVSYPGSDATAQLLQTFQDLENEIRGTVGANAVRELYSTKPMVVTGENAATIDPYAGYYNIDPVAANPLTNGDITTAPAAATANTFKGNLVGDGSGGDILDGSIPNIEETIRDNYSLIEEYCKNIVTDDLFLDDKATAGFEYYENREDVRIGADRSTGVAAAAVSSVDGSSLGQNNEIIVVNDSVFGGDAAMDTDVTAVGAGTGLHFDPQVLTSYLSSISSGDTSVTAAGGGAGTSVGVPVLAPAATVGASATSSANEMNFVGEQFGIVQRDAQMLKPTLSSERVYEDILTLNEQFRDNSAVKIEKPPTPNTVFLETDNKEALNWLF